MKTIEELKEDLRLTTQREADIIALINFNKSLEKAYSRLEKINSTPKDSPMWQEQKDYMERCLVRCENIIQTFTKKIENLEKKLGYRG
jgi:hypothetical protein